MKKFNKIVLPFTAATVLGLVALSTPVGAKTMDDVNVPSNAFGSVFVAALPITNLARTPLMARLVIGIDKNCQLVYENGPRGSVMPQLQPSALD